MRIAVLVYGRLEKAGGNYENISENLGKEHEIDYYASSDNSLEEHLHP
jgi:hypothetical protein